MIVSVFILNDAANKLPESHPIKLRLSTQWKSSLSKVQNRMLNHYVFNVKTDPDAPTGNWEASVEVRSFTKV
jgi:uncharacterized protein YfaS (alpha-2-macroglobulin family)